MCKIFGVTSITDNNRTKVIKLLTTMAPIMSQIDNDGFGYAAITKNGNVFGEKWLDVKKAFHKPPQPKKQVVDAHNKLVSSFGNFLEIDELPSDVIHGYFGEIDWNNAVSCMLHSRMATCGKTFDNVHPFFRENKALIHNGIIRNDNKFTKYVSTCDSEVLLSQYIDNKCDVSPENVEKAFNEIQGYYGTMILGKTLDNIPYLDIIKHHANLCMCFVPTLDTFVICTKSEMLKDAFKLLKWSHSPIYEMKDDIYLRLNAIDGSQIIASQCNFKSSDTVNSYSYHEGQWKNDIYESTSKKDDYLNDDYGKANNHINRYYRGR